MTPEKKPVSGAFSGYFRFFRRLVGYHLAILAVLVLLTTWTEGLGIALILPLISGDPKSGSDPLSRAIVQVLERAHLPVDLTGVLVALVAVAFFKGFLTFVATGYSHWLSAKITQDLRRRLVTACSRVDYRYMLGTNTGTLINLIYGQTTQTAAAFLTFSRLFPQVITIAFYSVILAVVDWRLTILVGVAGIGAMFLLRWPARLARLYSTKSADEAGAFAALLVQMIHSFKYLAATSSLDRLHRKIFASVRAQTVHTYRNGTLTALAYSLPQPVVALFLAGIMFYQLKVASTGLATGFVLLIYLYRMMNEIFALQVQWQTFSSQTGGVDAVVGMIAELETNKEVEGTTTLEGLRDSIELRDVTFAYQDRPVLKNVSLRIKKSTMVAFVGESGSGKTTLMDLVTGLVKPTSGKVLVDGTDLSTLTMTSWRSRIGFVPQDAMVFEDSVANNITLWSCDAKDPACLERVRAAARQAHCEEFILQMPAGYDSPIGDRGVKLSGGQRQRLSIARELFKKPDVLILDEATSALDSESEAFIQQSMEQLKGTLTLLVIAHRLSTIKGCDWLYVLQDGNVVEQGTYAELIGRKGSRFQEMAKLQNL